jgi:hypothetical protein
MSVASHEFLKQYLSMTSSQFCKKISAIYMTVKYVTVLDPGP